MGRQPLPTDTILSNGSDQYRIDTVLGPGGFGVTYLAHDMRFERDVAIKEYFPAEFAYREGTTTIRSSTRGRGQDFFEQGKRHFLEEARTLGRFRHEHIVRVINLFEQFNTAYMVLEFEEGQSLKNWLRNLGRRPSQTELDAILEPMLTALEVIHSKGIFHRDIAPDNIIMRPTGTPVLIDFGAARHFVRENSHTLGAIVKHGYSPPEQYTLDTKLQGAWSDIYSLCATLYFALVGEVPEEASKRQLNDTLLPIEDHLDAYHRELYRPSFIAALNHGLAVKPKDRPQTVAELRAHFESDSLEDAAPRSPVSTRGAWIAAPDPDVQAHSGPSATSSEPFRSTSGTVVQSLSTGASAPYSSPNAATSASQRLRPEDPSIRVHTPSSGAGATASNPYSETSARAVGLVALLVAAFSAGGFLLIGGIDHPGGLAAAMLVCAGLIATGFERTISVSRAGPHDIARTSTFASVMFAVALAIYWLPLAFWPISVLLAAAAALFSMLRFGRWVPLTLLVISLLHFAVAALLIVVASRSAQKDPYFLPMMGASLVVLAGFVLAAAIQMQRRWEPDPA